MAGQKIAIISGGLLLRKGLRSFLSSYFDNVMLEEFHLVKDFINSYTSNEFAVIFIQSRLFEEIAFDEYILKQLSDLILIGIISESENTNKLPSYFQDTISCAIDDEEMLEKLDKWKKEWLNDKLFENNDRELSQRETNVLKHVALGKTNKEIADKLFLSPHTIITHRKNITRKLGIYTVSGLTVYALINNLIEPSDVNK